MLCYLTFAFGPIFYYSPRTPQDEDFAYVVRCKGAGKDGKLEVLAELLADLRIPPLHQVHPLPVPAAVGPESPDVVDDLLRRVPVPEHPLLDHPDQGDRRVAGEEVPPDAVVPRDVHRPCRESLAKSFCDFVLKRAGKLDSIIYDGYMVNV